MRFITKETGALSRSDGDQPSQERKRRHGGLTIQSAEGVRFAYSSIAVPGFVGDVATAEYREHLGSIAPAVDVENQPQTAL
jgi:hypothetical protein